MTNRPPARVVYLHGFASSPGSNKAQAFAQALRSRSVEPTIPDLNKGDFFGLTISRQLRLLERETAGAASRSIVMIGSSLGGYTTALFAASSEVVAAAVLLAPAFDFASRWAQRLGPDAMNEWQRSGQTLVEHSGTGRLEPIGYGLMEDAARHAPYPDVRVPTLVTHGVADEVVLPDVSETFARDRPNVTLELIEADHSLAQGLDQTIARSLEFLSPWLPSA